MNHFVVASEQLSLEAIFNKVNMIIVELLDGGDDIKEYCEIVQTEVPTCSHIDFVKCCIEYAIDKSEATVLTASKLLHELLNSGTISGPSFNQG